MVKVIEGSLFDSKADFIVHQVNCQGVMGSGVAEQVAAEYPHVEREYLKYLRYCKKNHISPLGTVQYVPNQVWAIGFVDTMKNNRIEPCCDFQYIVNLFGQNDYGIGLQTDYNALEKAFKDIYAKAIKINATVAMPYKISCVRGGGDWNVVYPLICKVFDGVNVELWKLE